MFRIGKVLGNSSAGRRQILRISVGLKNDSRFALAKAVTIWLFSIAAVILMSNIAVCADSKDVQACKVNMLIDGGEWEYETSARTVGTALKEAGVEIGAKDEVYPKFSEQPYNKMRIRVVRVTEKVVTEKEVVKYKIISKFDPSGTAAKKIVRKGVNGEREIKYLHIFRDGVKSEVKVIDQKIIKKPINEEVTLSRSAFLLSRSGSSLRSLEMIATGYDASPMCCGSGATGRTASGMRAVRGVAAVDPRVIRLGTKLYVEGYGFCVAADTGGAIKGNRIDLCFDTYGEARRCGKRRVTVYILE